MKKRTDKVKIPQKLYTGLSKLFYKLGVNGNDVVEDFIYSYLEYAFTQSNIKNDIHLSTGFGRKSINSYLNKLESTEKITEENKSSYEILIGILEAFAKSSKNGEIPIYGKYESFNAAFNTIRNPSNNISAKSMLNKFIRVGILEKVDLKNVKFISSLPKQGLNDLSGTIRSLTENVNRLCHTLLHNLNVDLNDDGLTQVSYWSNSIAPKNYEPCKIQLREQIRMCIKNCSIIIDGFEEKGISKENAESKNIEFGVSAFIFKNLK